MIHTLQKSFEFLKVPEIRQKLSWRKDEKQQIELQRSTGELVVTAPRKHCQRDTPDG